ncbi:MAG: DUF4352 domain-containing protein [Candidatus Xenobia bacterium]
MSTTKFDPIRERLLRRSRQRVADLHAPTRRWVWNARVLVLVFGLGFIGTAVVILAVVGLYSILHPHPVLHVTGAKTPVIINPRVAPAPVETLAPVAVTQESKPSPVSTPAPSPSVDYIPEPPIATNVPAAPSQELTPVAPVPAPVASAPPSQELKPVAAVPAPIASAPVPPPAVAPAKPRIAPVSGYQVYLDGVPTGVTATIVAGVPYVAVDPIAVQAHQGVMIAPGTQEVRVGGQRVAGPVRMQGLQVTVPARNLAKALHRSMRIDRAGSRINLDPTTTPVATGPPNPGHVTTEHPAPPAAQTQPATAPIPSIEATEGAPLPEAFTPVIAGNGDMQVTVTNLEVTNEFRHAYHPSDGHQFVVVYASLQNTSQIVQVSEGKFLLRDGAGRTYEPLDNLSTLMLVVLRPAGINYGYSVFEIPQGTQPEAFMYVQENHAPLVVALHNN